MKLAKCPHCGDKPRLVADHERMGHNEFYLTTYVLCFSCLMRGPVFSELDFPDEGDRVRLAAGSWNKARFREEATR